MVAVPPGAIGCASGTAITVSSSAIVVVRRDETLRGGAFVAADLDRGDVDARPLVRPRGCVVDGREARSRMNVERVFFQAFQYRWNCSSAARRRDVAPGDGFGAGESCASPGRAARVMV
jgi:hypothetical protein